MIPLTVHHRTAYRYRRSVGLWPHRLMLCPRESRDLQVISYVVTVSPTAQVTWAHDVFGNAVATAVFQGASNSLVIDSVVELRLEASAWPIFNIAASAIVYPFRYSDDEWTDLGSLTRQQYPDPAGRLATWARAFVRGEQTDTLALLKDLSVGVSRWISYQSREDEGTQSPIQTLDRGWGSCRDFAVLFVEAARSLGFGARLVSGYLFNPDQMLVGSTDAGSTHAWAEVFVSGAGWISFDPTNRSVGGVNLIPVAVARDIRQAAPVSGSYAGDSDSLEGMSVEVLVTSNAAPAQRHELEQSWRSGSLLGLTRCDARFPGVRAAPFMSYRSLRPISSRASANCSISWQSATSPERTPWPRAIGSRFRTTLTPTAMRAPRYGASCIAATASPSPTPPSSGRLSPGIRASSRADIADICLGKLLARAPVGEDGVWPCEPVRHGWRRYSRISWCKVRKPASFN